MAYAGAEKRKHVRLSKTFVVSYRVYEEVDNYDLTQTKNVSVGGMLLTTNRKFNPGTLLSVDIRLPYLLEALNLKARVIDSKQIVKNLIYDTHLELIDIGEDNKEIINKTVVFHLKKQEEQK